MFSTCQNLTELAITSPPPPSPFSLLHHPSPTSPYLVPPQSSVSQRHSWPFYLKTPEGAYEPRAGARSCSDHCPGGLRGLTRPSPSSPSAPAPSLCFGCSTCPDAYPLGLHSSALSSSPSAPGLFPPWHPPLPACSLVDCRPLSTQCQLPTDGFSLLCFMHRA